MSCKFPPPGGRLRFVVAVSHCQSIVPRKRKQKLRRARKSRLSRYVTGDVVSLSSFRSGKTGRDRKRPPNCECPTHLPHYAVCGPCMRTSPTITRHGAVWEGGLTVTRNSSLASHRGYEERLLFFFCTHMTPRQPFGITSGSFLPPDTSSTPLRFSFRPIYTRETHQHTNSEKEKQKQTQTRRATTFSVFWYHSSPSLLAQNESTSNQRHGLWRHETPSAILRCTVDG